MSKVILGIDRIEEYMAYFKDKRIGLITNPSGINSHFETTIDLFKSKTNLVAMYSPEHGVRANVQAGVHVDFYIDEETNLPVYSLYGKSKKPTKEMLDVVDVIVIDIQDNGSRYYTFIYTMAYVMMACAENNKTFIVLDRPNPIGGEKVEGNLLDLKYRSFVGYYSMPQRHGMTIGELAKLFNEEYGIGCDLKIVPMLNYTRTMSFEDTKLPWVVPTPNIPSINTCYAYNTTCVFEGTNLEEGRGTTTPFELIGAPWIHAERFAEKLNSLNIPGVFFRPQWFTPVAGKYPKQMCGGVFLHITDRQTFDTVRTSWILIDTVWNMYGEHFKINAPYVVGRPCMFEFETGCDYIINRKFSLEKQLEILKEEQEKFREIRKPYLIY